MAFRKASKRKGTRQAAAVLARLGDAEFRERVRLTEAELRVLDRIASGAYVRNAASIMRAIEFRASYAYSKPKQELAVSVAETDTATVTDEEWTTLSRLQHEVRGG